MVNLSYSKIRFSEIRLNAGKVHRQRFTHQSLIILPPLKSLSVCHHTFLFLDKSIGATTETEALRTTEHTTMKPLEPNIAHTTAPAKKSMFMNDYGDLIRSIDLSEKDKSWQPIKREQNAKHSAQISVKTQIFSIWEFFVLTSPLESSGPRLILEVFTDGNRIQD